MNKRKLAIALCYMATAVTAMAQSSEVSMEIEDFVEYCGENVAAEIYHSPKSTSYSKCFRFDLPNKKKNAQVLQNLASLFKECMNDAYQYRELKAGMSLGEPQRVVYGDNNEFFIDFFKYLNHNTIVMLVKDSADISKRYGYVLDWYKAGSRLVGSARIIYGKDPQYVANMPANSKDVLTLRADSPNLRQQMEEARRNGRLAINLVSTATTDSVITDLEFLKRFGNLRGSLLEKRNEPTLSAGIMQKLLELCKNYAYLLEEDTRMVCLEEIERMTRGEFVRDPYIKGLLSLAGTYLEEAEEP